MKYIPYGTQWVDESDIQAVVDVLRSDWLTQGPAIKKFEEELAAYCGSKYAVAVSSGTAALHLACLAAGIGKGDTVVTSPITFVASANCALYVGGQPRFVDIDPLTCNMSVSELEKLLAREKTAAVIPVHFGGLPCEMEKIGDLAEAHNLTVIEDACHALGAEYQTINGEWVKVGSCCHSSMTVFSFHPVKHITTGEGGAITTNSRELYDKLIMLRTHGITRAAGKLKNNEGPWYYEMQALGYNYRITDMQAALGESQLRKLDDFVARRRTIAARYDRAFADISEISLIAEPPGFKSAYHLYTIQLPAENAESRRREVFAALRVSNIGVNVHYIPVHLQPYYRERFGYRPGDFPLSEAYYQRCISIPMYPKMRDEDVDFVATYVRKAVSES